MPRSAEQRSSRAAKERERRAVASPASRQARPASDKDAARDRRVAETPPSRQARLATDCLIATLLSTSYGFTHVPAPSESWTSPSLSPHERRRFGCSRDFSPRRTRRYTGAHFLSTLDMAQCVSDFGTVNTVDMPVCASCGITRDPDDPYSCEVKRRFNLASALLLERVQTKCTHLRLGEIKCTHFRISTFFAHSLELP